ncbi:MAG: prepilin-type N-terminal cleavage/methylation domain-containing protein [Akkermansia sp.]
MKNHSAYSRLRAAKGFTLMEILVVMVIIVVLATLTISIYTWLETRKNEQATESIVRKIEMGLESYHSDHDRYPYGTEAPFNNHGVAVANGEEYSSNVVYMALFGDHKNEGVPGRDTTIYNDELNLYAAQKQPAVREVHVKSKDGRPVPLISCGSWSSPTLPPGQRAVHHQTDRAKNLKMGNGLNPDYDSGLSEKTGTVI